MEEQTLPLNYAVEALVITLGRDRNGYVHIHVGSRRATQTWQNASVHDYSGLTTQEACDVLLAFVDAELGQ